MSFRTSAKFASTRIDETAPRRGFSVQRVAQAASLPASAPNLTEAADLYYRKSPRGLSYRHFESAKAAIDFVRSTLSAQQMVGAVLQIGEQRYQNGEVAALVERMSGQVAAAAGN